MDKEILIQYLNELFPDAHCELNFSNHYELLIAVILSAQTTDKKVNLVTKELFEKYPNFASLASANYSEVEKIIHPLGLSKTKAYNIIKTSQKVADEFNGQPPLEKDKLLTLPGVGFKVASVYLGEVLHQLELPVDTHIFRISHRLNLSDKKTPEAVSLDLKEFFKGEDLMHLHHQLIFFGRYFCTSRTPNCAKCRLSNNCNFAKSG